MVANLARHWAELVTPLATSNAWRLPPPTQLLVGPTHPWASEAFSTGAQFGPNLGPTGPNWGPTGVQLGPIWECCLGNGSSHPTVCPGGWKEPFRRLGVDGLDRARGGPVNCKRDEHWNLLCPLAGQAE